MKKFLSTLLASILGTFIALGLCSLFFMGIVGSLMAFTESPVPVVPEKAILRIDLSKSITEQTQKGSIDLSGILPSALLSNAQTSSLGILDAVRALEIAAEDPAIKLVSISSTSMMTPISTSKAEELRAALVEFHKSGKPIIAYGTNFNLTQYYIASVADKIYSHSMAMNEFKGISTQILFLKDILDKVGVNVQLIRHGKYKSAGEQFIANDISKANREQNEVMLNSLWKEISGAICQSRGLSQKNLDEMINHLSLNTPSDMKKYGMIDEILTMDEITGKHCELFQVDEEKDLKTISLADYARAKVVEDYKVKDQIAIIYADGEIVDGKGTENIAGMRFASLIKKVRKDKDIKGVILRVNSPGGSAQAAELIRNELRLLNEEKPVVASFGDYAASGGYWISAESDQIFTNNTTLTGSIGVFSMIPEFGSIVRNKLHVNPVSISTHQHSDMMSLMRPFDKTETDYMQHGVELVYDQFLNVVSNGRKMTPEEVDEIAQGRVWAGSDALNIRLADKKGGLIDAIEYLAQTCHLEKYRIVAYPTVQSPMEKLMESMTETQANIGILSDPERLYKEAVRSIRETNGIYARLPYIYEFY